jgi:hypothetical protein
LTPLGAREFLAIWDCPLYYIMFSSIQSLYSPGKKSSPSPNHENEKVPEFVKCLLGQNHSVENHWPMERQDLLVKPET